MLYLLNEQNVCWTHRQDSTLRYKPRSRLRRLHPQSNLTQQLGFRDEPFRYEFFAVESEKISLTVECEAT